MKTLLIFAFALPILSACASSQSTDADTASDAEPKAYVTGSIIPQHVKKGSSDQTADALLPADYGRNLLPFADPGKLGK
jgi:hypothetical protein